VFETVTKKPLFELYGTAHNWINVKDFLKKPKAVLVETFELEGKADKSLFDNFLEMDIKSDFKFMLMRDVVEQHVFKILRDNKRIIKAHDYVVPSHISFYEGLISITVDCFKGARK